MDLNLANKKFVVTGGTSGLGFATAKCLIAEGAKVLVTGRSEEKFNAAKDSLGAAGAGFAFFAGDNGDARLAAKLKDFIAHTWGKIDGLLISVGGPPASKALATTDKMWSDAFATVFLGTTRLINELSTVMNDGGAIALVLSSTVKVAIPTIAISNGLRPGLAMLAKNYADELGARAIRVNAVLPGSFATERIKALGFSASSFSSTSLHRIGEPDEFGRMATFLLSPAASYVTGAAISVDGGSTKSL